jgi:hypothetical protein
MTIFGHVKENMKSRVKGDFHARFCGKAGVKFPCLTRLGGIPGKLLNRIEGTFQILILFLNIKVVL